MILILSQSSYEPSTDAVVDWIEHLGGTVTRLNGEDLDGRLPFTLGVDGARGRGSVMIGGREVDLAEVRTVWLRRWHQYATGPMSAAGELPPPLRSHLIGEFQATTHGLHDLLSRARWLTRPEDLRLGKLAALRLAAAAGLDVPATLVTSSRTELLRFAARHGRVITKCAGEAERFELDGASYATYTAELDAADLANLPPRFFPSLFQECLDKRYEIRVFYLDGDCYPMAIFSQASGQTVTDFRRYEVSRPNRNVPVRLDAPVADALRRFMQSAEMNTGSIDLVRTRCGRTVFLEVNPAGQFSAVSQACNYHLERKVAEALLRRDRDEVR